MMKRCIHVICSGLDDRSTTHPKSAIIILFYILMHIIYIIYIQYVRKSKKHHPSSGKWYEISKMIVFQSIFGCKTPHPLTKQSYHSAWVAMCPTARRRHGRHGPDGTGGAGLDRGRHGASVDEPIMTKSWHSKMAHL